MTRKLHVANDDGFTLVEVVVAITLLTMVATAAGLLMIRSISSNRTLSEQQVATQVARQTVEQASAVPALLTSGTSALVKGRPKAAVVAAWNAASTAGIDISDTYTGSGTTTFDAHTYDSTATATSTQTLPITATRTIDNNTYTVTTLIGTCVRERSGGDCTRSATGDELFRITVVVTWTSGNQRIPHQYLNTELVDPAHSPTFNVNRKPYAYDDTADAVSGVQASIPVIANDKGSWALTGAVTIVTGPSRGTATVDSGTNNILYTPATNFSGTDSIVYKARDTYGNDTGTATLTVTVYPKANPDSVTTASKNTVISVTSNDNGGPTSSSIVAIVGTPSGGTATVVAGPAIRFTAPAPVNATYTFDYTVTVNGLQSKPATVTVDVKPGAAPTATNATVNGTVKQTVSVNLANSSTVSGVATYSTSGAGATVSGNTLSYTPTRVGTTDLPYAVTDDWGRTATATITVNAVAPKLVVNSFSTTQARNSSITRDLISLGYVSGGISPYTYSVTAPAGAPTASVSSSGVLRLKSGSTRSSWTYTLSVTDSLGSVTSNTFTVTVN